MSRDKSKAGRPTKHEERYKNVGRPTKIDDIIIQKLEDAFKIGCTDAEACFQANIATTTLYNYQLKNPEFVERKEALKASPTITARQTVVDSLKEAGSAWRWLEKKDKDFIPASKIEHAGHVTVDGPTDIEMSDAEKAALLALREARRKRIEEKSDKMQ